MTPLLVLLIVIALGLFLGRLSLLGISFGTSAILFVALAAGHFGYVIPDGLGDLGMAFFVYCVGISAGPTFFRGLASNGRAMACLGALIVVAGTCVAWGSAKLLDLPADLAGGLMAGAMTSTPALGAVSGAIADPTRAAVGFGVAYPIGIVAVVLAVQLACKFMRFDDTDNAVDATTMASKIQRRVVEIANPVISGQSPNDLEMLVDSGCQISRIRIEGKWRPMRSGYRFALGDHLLLIGNERDIRRVAATLGQLRDEDVELSDVDQERRTFVVTAPDVYGSTLKELHFRSQYNVTVARVRRHDVEFVPSGNTRIEFGDNLVMVGSAQDLAKMDAVVGHRPRVMNETDLLSLVLGIAIGIVIGNATIVIGGASISLGLAGGPLLIGLILGHFRRIGPVSGAYPPAAQLLMTEGGLALFLADAGFSAGTGMSAVLAEHGLALCFVAIAIAVIPMICGFLLARYVFKLTLLQSLGATCGGMTSTPGLAVLTSTTDSSQPVTSYVAAYPVALVLMTMLSRMLIELLRSGIPSS